MNKNQLLDPPKPKEKSYIRTVMMSFLVVDIILFVLFFAFVVSKPLEQTRPILRFNEKGEFTIMQVFVSLLFLSRLLILILMMTCVTHF